MPRYLTSAASWSANWPRQRRRWRWAAAGLLRGGVEAGPTGLLRVPSAALSMLEMAVAAAGIPAVGYFAQIPHYVSGPYPIASLELLRALERLGRGDRIVDIALDLGYESPGAFATMFRCVSTTPFGSDVVPDV